jgi:hypothetical protein
MGYTHYWTSKRNLNETELVFIETVVNSTRTPLSSGCGNVDDLPVVERGDDYLVNINGVSDDAHENLVLYPDKEDWNFCKTARKPYDTIIVAILSYLHDRGAIEWSSDGEASYGDFKQGKALKSRIKRKLS